MKYVSTRGAGPVALNIAIRAGQAPDGGLYIPERPVSSHIDPARPLAEAAAAFLAPFVEGDLLASDLGAICAEAFDFPVPIVCPDPRRPHLLALELFHGPTGAFKDFGARFLMACLDRLAEPARVLTVLAATSGDAGGAVGCAAEGRSGVRAGILFPKGRVSGFQKRQLGCWRAPVEAWEVDGDFDACQRLVKAAFADERARDAFNLTSANSINIGRLLPQAAYIAWSAARVEAETGTAPGLIIPTGNLGHGLAAIWARAAGAPIAAIQLATNANRALSDWSAGGDFLPRASVATLANAMDVGAPSNYERLAVLADPRALVSVERVGDAAIADRIRADHFSFGYVWCPHSAVGAEAYARLPQTERDARPWIVAATAHPYKFADIVAPLIGAPIAPTPALAAVLARPARTRALPADLIALIDALSAWDFAA